MNHLKIEALDSSQVPHPSAAESQKLLETAAGGKDPMAAREAYERLLGGGAETRKVMHDAHDQSGVDWAAVQALIDRLSADDATAQAVARSHLIEMGAVIDRPVRLATQSESAVESSDNAQAVLDQIVAMPIVDAAKRKAAVADRVLAVIGEK